MANIRVWVLLALTVSFASADLYTGPPLENIFFRLYSKVNGIIDVHLIDISSLILKLDLAQSIELYIHGLLESVDDLNVQTVVNAYLSNTLDNVIIMDYRDVAALNASDAVACSDGVSGVLSNFLINLVNANVNLAKIHLIGYSLGVHIAALAARKLPFRIPRITGLDPIGPELFLVSNSLNSNDADFVDVIHTDRGFFGSDIVQGHVDHYPNCGRRVQRGCDTQITSLTEGCSSLRAVAYYAESIGRPQGFLSIACLTELDFIQGLCVLLNPIPMGYAVPLFARGTYYLATNSASPFGIGANGLTYIL